jgi:hypothetical protein
LLEILFLLGCENACAFSILAQGGLVVGNVFLIDVKDRGRINMSKINIAIWICLETSFLDY